MQYKYIYKMKQNLYSLVLFVSLMIIISNFAMAQSGGVTVEPNTCIRIESGTKVNITDGDLVLKSTSSGDASLIDFGTASSPAMNYSGTNSGEAKVQRYLTEGQWHLIAPPISDAVSGMFLNDFLQWFQTSDGTWHDIIPTNISLIPMQGYGLWSVESAPSTEVFEGTTNTGSFNFSFVNSGNRWNLVGNPFPSDLDWDEVTIPTNLEGTIYLFDPTSGSNGEYKIYLEGGSSNTTTQYIPSGQGFFVRASTSGGGTLTFTNSERTHNTTQSFYKNEFKADYPWMNLTVSGNDLTSQTGIRFMEEASDGFDRLLDCWKVLSSSPELPQIYTRIGNEPIALNSLPSIAGHEEIPMSFVVEVPGTYTIGVKDLENFDEDQPIFLKDKKENFYQNLRKYPEYTFSYKAGDDPDRFVILFFNPNGVEDYTNDLGSVNIFAYDKTVCVVLDDDIAGETVCDIFNVMGQKLLTRNVFAGRNEMVCPFEMGTYIVRVHAADKMITEKVFLK